MRTSREMSGTPAICITGVPGVGKTTLLRLHVSEVEPRDRAITGSAVLEQVIRPATFEEFDGWPEPRRVAAREEAVVRLRQAKSRTVGRLLVDGHLSLRNRRDGGLTKVFTEADRNFYDALVLVDGTVDEVRARRCAESRSRGGESPSQIAEHLVFEKVQFDSLVEEMRVPHLVLAEHDQTNGVHLLGGFLARVAPLGGLP
jgi:adenylate kinase